MSNKPIIQCNHLAKRFTEGGLDVGVLEDVNLEVQHGERLAIIGRSGTGKSTLLHLLGGLDTPSAGQVQIMGNDIGSIGQTARGRLRNKHLGFVYQFHHLLGEFTALENVAMPLLIRGTAPEEASSKAEAVLKGVGLGNRLPHKPGELSGGERQRAAIARALVTQPACLLADEPTGNLDSQTADQVFDMMLTLNNELDTSLVVVTHDTRLASKMDRVLSLDNGRIQEA